jgi:large exoprotein involved in heme utilization and adhesion
MRLTSGVAIQGSEVTFYSPQPSSFAIGGSGDATLTAPTTGPYRGILFWVDRNAPAGNLNLGTGSGSFNFNGAIYAPTQNASVEGNFIGATPWGMVIGNTVTLMGDATLTMSTPPANVAPSLFEPSLVE